MIIGTGIDIIEIERIKKALTHMHFLHKYFTPSEIKHFYNPAHAQSAASLAGNFAGKEAVAKALGVGFAFFSPIEIEILRNNAGKPFVVLHSRAEAHARMLGVSHLHITISHSKQFAVAYTLAEGGFSDYENRIDE